MAAREYKVICPSEEHQKELTFTFPGRSNAHLRMTFQTFRTELMCNMDKAQVKGLIAFLQETEQAMEGEE